MGNIGGYGAGTYVLLAVEGNMPCSLGCFHISEVYETMRNQPLCLSCISPHLYVLCGTSCFADVVTRQPTVIDSIVIFKQQTVYAMFGQETLCHNSWGFVDCCRGRGPANKGTEKFTDKYCACAIEVVSLVEGVYQDKVRLYY